MKKIKLPAVPVQEDVEALLTLSPIGPHDWLIFLQKDLERGMQNIEFVDAESFVEYTITIGVDLSKHHCPIDEPSFNFIFNAYKFIADEIFLKFSISYLAINPPIGSFYCREQYLAAIAINCKYIYDFISTIVWLQESTVLKTDENFLIDAVTSSVGVNVAVRNEAKELMLSQDVRKRKIGLIVSKYLRDW